MARRRPSGGGGAAALAKYFLLVWAVALGALVVLHERSLADEVRRDWAAVEGEVRRDWAAVEGAVEREAHYLLDGMKAPPAPPEERDHAPDHHTVATPAAPDEHRARKRMFATPPPRVATPPPRAGSTPAAIFGPAQLELASRTGNHVREVVPGIWKRGCGA